MSQNRSTENDNKPTDNEETDKTSLTPTRADFIKAMSKTIPMILFWVFQSYEFENPKAEKTELFIAQEKVYNILYISLTSIVVDAFFDIFLSIIFKKCNMEQAPTLKAFMKNKANQYSAAIIASYYCIFSISYSVFVLPQKLDGLCLELNVTQQQCNLENLIGTSKSDSASELPAEVGLAFSGFYWILKSTNLFVRLAYYVLTLLISAKINRAIDAPNQEGIENNQNTPTFSQTNIQAYLDLQAAMRENGFAPICEDGVVNDQDNNNRSSPRPSPDPSPNNSHETTNNDNNDNKSFNKYIYHFIIILQILILFGIYEIAKSANPILDERLEDLIQHCNEHLPQETQITGYTFSLTIQKLIFSFVFKLMHTSHGEITKNMLTVIINNNISMPLEDIKALNMSGTITPEIEISTAVTASFIVEYQRIVPILIACTLLLTLILLPLAYCKWKKTTSENKAQTKTLLKEIYKLYSRSSTLTQVLFFIILLLTQSKLNNNDCNEDWRDALMQFVWGNTASYVECPDSRNNIATVVAVAHSIMIPVALLYSPGIVATGTKLYRKYGGNQCGRNNNKTERQTDPLRDPLQPEPESEYEYEYQDTTQPNLSMI